MEAPQEAVDVLVKLIDQIKERNSSRPGKGGVDRIMQVTNERGLSTVFRFPNGKRNILKREKHPST